MLYNFFKVIACTTLWKVNRFKGIAFRLELTLQRLTRYWWVKNTHLWLSVISNNTFTILQFSLLNSQQLQNSTCIHVHIIYDNKQLYEVGIHDFRKIAIRKTVIVMTFCIFSFCQHGRQQSSCTSGSALITAEGPLRISPPCYFSYPPPRPFRRPPERECSRPARSSPLAAS
jgi:hypothetical protein